MTSEVTQCDKITTDIMKYMFRGEVGEPKWCCNDIFMASILHQKLAPRLINEMPSRVIFGGNLMKIFTKCVPRDLMQCRRFLSGDFRVLKKFRSKK